jgi:hypothetical protein
VIAVFELLSKKISRGEADDVRHALPLIMIASFRPVRMVPATGFSALPSLEVAFFGLVYNASSGVEYGHAGASYCAMGCAFQFSP